MKGKIILLTILVASAIALKSAKFTGTACACSELPTESECKLAIGRCAWGSACTAASTDCTTYTAQAGCDQIDGCAWNGTACGTFSNCTSYVVTNGQECYAKAAKCAPGAVNGTNTTCAEQTITNCTTITDQTTCTNLGCTYASSACAASTCAAQNQTACTSVGSIALNNLVLCAWNNTTTTCADANVTTALTLANCAEATDVTYAWINGACTACTGQSSSASLLAVLGFAATILL